MSDLDFLANIPLAAAVASPSHSAKPRRGRRKPVQSDDSESSTEKLVPAAPKNKKRRQGRRRDRSELDSSTSSSSSSDSSIDSSDKSLEEIKPIPSPTKVSKSVPKHLEAISASDRKRMASSESTIEKPSRRKEKHQAPTDDDDDDSESDATAPSTGNDTSASLDFLLGISLGESPEPSRVKKSNPRMAKGSRDIVLTNSAPSELVVGSFPPRQNSRAPKAGSRDTAGSAAGASTMVPSKSKRSKKEREQTRPKSKLQPVIIKGERLTRKNVSSLLDNRFAVRSPGGFPFFVSSIIPLERNKTKKQDSSGNSGAESALAPLRLIRNKRSSVSYAHLLGEVPDAYDANFLDHDIPTPDKYKITINLPSYRQSVIPWVKAGDLKKNQNSIFQEHHPWLKSNITLSKIRSVKRKIVDVAISKALDVGVAALSYVYFEKLILKNLVTKQNYKIYGAACLLLAEKFYGTRPKSFKFVIEALEKIFKLSSKDILSHEFTVYKDLSFSLFVDGNEVLPHLVKLQSSQDYLDHLFEYSAQERKKSHEQREKFQKRQMQLQNSLTRRAPDSIDGVGMVINRNFYDPTNTASNL